VAGMDAAASWGSSKGTLLPPATGHSETSTCGPPLAHLPAVVCYLITPQVNVWVWEVSGSLPQ
jgi:hypothetical protein